MEAISRQNPTNCSGWHKDFRWPGLVELCCSGKWAGLGFSSSCLAGSAWPGLVKNVSSVFRCFFYPLYLTLRHIEGVCHISSGSGLQPLDNHLITLVSGWILGMFASSCCWCEGLVYWGCFYTHLRPNWSIISHRWSSYDKATTLFDSFVLHWNIITKDDGIKMSHFL